jgi:3-methyladenine DNA glycosylase/8-oxoguanine DNA glycosylase
VLRIVERLAQMFPVAECALYHNSAFELLVATILSAQCTDERVNKSTPELFRRFPNAAALAAASQEDVEEIVKPLGFFRAKAANIRAMAAGVVERHGGEVAGGTGWSGSQDCQRSAGDVVWHSLRCRRGYSCQASDQLAGFGEFAESRDY